MVHRLAIAVATVLLLAGSVRLAEACRCIVSGPACQVFWRTDAVFDGTVVSIDRLPRDVEVGGRTISINDKLVRFVARRSWKGVDAGPVEVVTGQGHGDCGFDFVVGERYLVFAHSQPSDGRLSASICSLTERFDPTDDTAAFLDSLSKPSSGGRIFGSVELLSRALNRAAASSNAPMELTLRLSGDGRESSTTSKKGRYEFRGLPPAQYRIELLVPDGYSTYSPERTVEIPNPRACAAEEFALAVNGRVSGQLLRPDGGGAEGVPIELVDADAPLDQQHAVPTFTTEGGHFEFKGLPPGRYRVGLSLRRAPSESSPYARTVYPGPLPPETIVVAFGGAVQLQPWKVPRLTPAKVSGTLVWRDGAPASRIALVALDVTDVTGKKAPRGGIAMTDENGRFSLEVWEGRSYALAVNLPGPGRTPTDVSRLSVTAGMGPVRVRISVDRQQR